MTKVQIITIIVTALISAFAKSIFDRIFGAYMPDKKKLASYARKFLLFALSYILPIAEIIYLMVAPGPVDKFFVFSMAFFFSILVYNVSGYLNSPTRIIDNIERFYTQQYKLHNANVAVLGEQSLMNKTVREYFNEIKNRISLDEIRIEKLEKEIHSRRNL